ncbi:hypothetical protein WMY93_024474 [Mugilogobius chulae]|uniref:PEX14-like helix-turn-helix domain-containing protein n=1 Tax=Mugilogobius chulae TaxID=88201 RepID=A0AAW0NBM7_9GOBI
MKLFYYNRFVEPIDRSAYKQWRSLNQTSDCSSDVLPTEETSEGRAETETVNLTFAEVMEAGPGGERGPRSEKNWTFNRPIRTQPHLDCKGYKALEKSLQSS